MCKVFQYGGMFVVDNFGYTIWCKTLEEANSIAEKFGYKVK